MQEFYSPLVDETSRRKRRTRIIDPSYHALTLRVDDLIGGASQSSDLFTGESHSNHHSNYIEELADEQKDEPELVPDIFSENENSRYFRRFLNSVHHNWYGLLGDRRRPCVISYKKNENGNVDAIVRTCEWTRYVEEVRCNEADLDIVPVAVLKNVFGSDKCEPILRPCLNSYSVNRIGCYDELFAISALGIGIVYQKPGQVNEDQMLANTEESDELSQFLALIGRRVRLKGFRGYAAGLDVVSNSTGLESVYVQYKRVQIMFHVSTMLPFAIRDPQQIKRKRHIGNDNIVIVFQKSPTPFKPDWIQSRVICSFIVITPIRLGSDTFYKVKVFLKKSIGCKFTIPRIHKSAIFRRDTVFNEWMYQKFISLQTQAYRGDELSPLVLKMRRAQLQGLVDQLEVAEVQYWKYFQAQMNSYCKGCKDRACVNNELDEENVSESVEQSSHLPDDSFIDLKTKTIKQITPSIGADEINVPDSQRKILNNI